MTRDEHKKAVDNILAYLQTAKEIMELEKLITSNAIMYQRILDQIESLESTLASLN